MKRFSSLLLLAVLLAGCGVTARRGEAEKDLATLKEYAWDWQPAGDTGLEAVSATLAVFGSTQTVSMARIPLRGHVVSVVDAGGPAAGTTSSLAIGEGALAAVNGSYFNMATLCPVTFVKDEGVVICAETRDDPARCNGLVRMDGSRLDILTADEHGHAKATARWREALVSGPVLLENGRVISYTSEETPAPKSVRVEPSYYEGFFARRHPRTLLGYTKSGWLYFIVVDGRFPGRADGMSIAELQILSRALGLYECINLDGGGSSTLWVNGSVLNHPADNGRFDHDGERIVPNILIVK